MPQSPTPLRPYSSKKPVKRKKRRTGLVVALCVFLVLIAALALFLQDNMEFTSDGIRFTFNEGEEERKVVESLTAVHTPELDGAAFAPAAAPAFSVYLNGLPPSGTPAIEARLIDLDNYRDSELSRLVSGLSGDGVSSVVVELKGRDGRLSYQSASALAKKASLSAADGKLESFVDLCGSYSIKVTGIIHCFLDNRLPKNDNTLALLTTTGALYIDPELNTWLDPACDEVRQYILELIDDAERIGLREVILDDFRYPLPDDKQAEGEADRTKTLMELLKSLDSRAASMRIGVVVYDDTLGEGASEGRGQELSTLTELCDRLWVYADDLSGAINYRGQAALLSEEAAHKLCAILGDEYLSDELYIQRYKDAAYAATEE